MKLKFWKRAPKKRIITQPRIHPPKMPHIEAFVPEPIETMRLYTQADYEEAIEIGKQSSPNWRKAYRAGYVAGSAVRPPTPSWNQKEEIRRAERRAWAEGYRAALEQLAPLRSGE